MQRPSANVRGNYSRVGHAVNLRQAARSIWRQKRIFLAFPIAFLILAIVRLHLTEYEYTVTMQVHSLQATQGDIGQLGQIASMAGVNLRGTNQIDAFQLYQQGLFTRETADELAADQGLLRLLFPKEWDPQSGTWRERGGALRGIANTLRYAIGAPEHEWRPPDGARVQEFVAANLHITQDIKSPVATIDMNAVDPVAAVYFMNRLNTVVDGSIKRRALARATTYIDYLNKQLQVVTNVGLQQALIQLVIDQEKQKMAASSSLSYSAELFQKPVSTQWPTSPNPITVVGLAVFIGLLLGSLAALYWDWVTKRRGPRLVDDQTTAGN
jgi:hypothetical protein